MKKLTKVLLAILAVVCAAVFFFACDNGGDKNAAETYTVTFYDGAQEVDSKKVEKGGTVETLPEINKAGHEFIGWRIDNDPTQPFDENTAVNFDLKVYAAWNRTGFTRYRTICREAADRPKERIFPPRQAKKSFSLRKKDLQKAIWGCTPGRTAARNMRPVRNTSCPAWICL